MGGKEKKGEKLRDTQGTVNFLWGRGGGGGGWWDLGSIILKIAWPPLSLPIFSHGPPL